MMTSLDAHCGGFICCNTRKKKLRWQM
jgi:hypothetical protein